MHHLKGTDFPKRMKFCELILLRSQENVPFWANIIWTDELKLTENDLLN